MVILKILMKRNHKEYATLPMCLRSFQKAYQLQCKICDNEQQTQSDDTVDQAVLTHFAEIEDRFHARNLSPNEKICIPNRNRMFRQAAKYSNTTLNAIDDWPSASKIPPSLQSLSQKVFIVVFVNPL